MVTKRTGVLTCINLFLDGLQHDVYEHRLRQSLFDHELILKIIQICKISRL